MKQQSRIIESCNTKLISILLLVFIFLISSFIYAFSGKRDIPLNSGYLMACYINEMKKIPLSIISKKGCSYPTAFPEYDIGYHDKKWRSVESPDIGIGNDLLGYIEGGSYQTSRIKLFNMKTNTDLEPIAFPKTILMNPAFSHHSTLVAYLQCPNTEVNENYEFNLGVAEIMNRETKPIVLLNHLSSNKPSWSPDDRYIAVTRNDNTVAIVSLDGKVSRVIGKGFCPVWSLDGKRIYCYENKKTIIAYDLDENLKTKYKITIYRSNKSFDITRPLVFGPAEHYIFAYTAGSKIASLMAMDEVWNLTLIDLNKKKTYPLINSCGATMGFTYCAE